MKTNNDIDPYQNIAKGLNDENLWQALNKRIEEIDIIRRSIRSQLNIASTNNEKQKIIELKTESNELLQERFALHNEMKKIRTRIKKSRRERNGQLTESLAIEFMLIAQKKLTEPVFNDIRNLAAMNIVNYKS
jgi:molecular chaperone GrpE (heat shock protein)